MIRKRGCAGCRCRVALAAGLLAFANGACAYRVTPPANPQFPTTVFIADYGDHASLVLPRGQERWAEYAYGEWEWFARGNDAWHRGIPVMLGSGGALGTRRIECAPEHLSDAFPPGTQFLSVQVARAATERLLTRLDARFAAAERDTHFNRGSAMNFVPDPQRYSLGHHCNTAVADWLIELGCEVRKGGLSAEFEVAASGGRSRATGIPVSPPR